MLDTSMNKVADLELSLRRIDTNLYSADLKYSPADSDSDERAAAKIPLDIGSLRTLAGDAYGRALGSALFGAEKLGGALTRARVAAQSVDAALRFRLVIGEDAAELHAVRWETLRDLEGAEMFNGARSWFSRYLASPNWRPVRSRPERALRALVLIASPAELADNPGGMTPLPVEKELAWAERSLAGVKLTHLTSGAAEEASRPTLANLTARLADGHDILFLICHGALTKDTTGMEPLLWLENLEGGADVVSASKLVAALQRLPEMPRLVVLASCQSAGTGRAGEALPALGPQLAAAGVPAVIAMQGKVAIETIDSFMPEFFTKLREHGQIDRAMAEARGAAVAAQRGDYWMPVLFMRLRSGSLWYRAGFGATSEGAGNEFDRWATIKTALEEGECTPILGPGLVEGLLGSPRELAQKLAERFKFPMAQTAFDDLPSVAQYLAVKQHSKTLRREVRMAITEEVNSRFGDRLKNVDPADLGLVISEAGKLARAANPKDPHRVLASKPFSIYITANTDSLMEDALVEAGRAPRSDFARWNEMISDLRAFPTLFERERDYRPSVKEPLVYHLFGQLKVMGRKLPESLVLTEDDFFDYLLRIGSKGEAKDLMPGAIGAAMAAHALLFIGFRLDDWSFRVLLRSIYSKEGSQARAVGTPWPCVGAQMTPEEDRMVRPDGAREYFEKYLNSSKIDIYWGGSEEFLGELDRQTADLTLPPPAAAAAASAARVVA